MTDTFRALCAELLSQALELIDTGPRDDATIIRHQELFDRARAALAQPEPVGPTDEGLLSWAHFYGIDYVDIDRPSKLDAEKKPVRSDELRIFARAVLTRWGRQPAPTAPAP